eukprot:12791020-Alexandrium_andersonii.AAC.1
MSKAPTAAVHPHKAATSIRPPPALPSHLLRPTGHREFAPRTKNGCVGHTRARARCPQRVRPTSHSCDAWCKQTKRAQAKAA